MAALQDGVVAFLQGIYDSIKGFCVTFFIDSTLQKEKAIVYGQISRGSSNTQVNNPNKEEKKPGKEPATIIKSLYTCFLLNFGSLFAIIILILYIFLPIIKYIFVYYFYKNNVKGGETTALWIEQSLKFVAQLCFMPMWLICRILNSFYYNDISKLSMKYVGSKSLGNSGTTQLSDMLLSTMIQLLFYAQAGISYYIFSYYSPLASTVIYVAHNSLLYALASFEYKWFEISIPLHTRLIKVEANWPYYLGFGLPSALLVNYASNWDYFGGVTLALIYPFLIVSATIANPAKTTCFKIPAFVLSVFVTNKFFDVLPKGVKKDPLPSQPVVRKVIRR